MGIIFVIVFFLFQMEMPINIAFLDILLWVLVFLFNSFAYFEVLFLYILAGPSRF